jgi:hypothetical protein
VTTSSIVFTDPRHAAVRFNITYQAAIDFGEQSGTALVVDGQWKVSRATVCTVMAGPAPPAQLPDETPRSAVGRGREQPAGAAASAFG